MLLGLLKDVARKAFEQTGHVNAALLPHQSAFDSAAAGATLYLSASSRLIGVAYTLSPCAISRQIDLMISVRTVCGPSACHARKAAVVTASRLACSRSAPRAPSA
jgi:hypothetical protein